ncbi:MAG TPA: hypothetical protein VFX98_08885, partial [Longimicrobiaceae bacterium]|nr:hypothetical protein [Longimicrobiaceae bacterium]
MILVVRHDSLLQVTGSGALAPIARLPRWRMKPAPSREPGFAYLLSGGIFDLDDEDDLYTVGLPGSVFLLSDHDGGVRRVVRLDSPPVALSEGVDGYYLALEGG